MKGIARTRQKLIMSAIYLKYYLKKIHTLCLTFLFKFNFMSDWNRHFLLFVIFFNFSLEGVDRRSNMLFISDV